METAVIIDCIVAAALLGFLIYGACRGLFQTVAGLLIVIVALVGATAAARSLTPIATNLLRPVIESSITQRMDDAIGGEPAADVPPQTGDGYVKPTIPEIGQGTPDASQAADPLIRIQAGELLKMMGLDEAVTGPLSDKVEEKVRETGVSIAMAVVESVMESIVYMILFVLSFLLLTLLLRLVAKAMDLAMKLPGVHALNGLGGAAVGLAEGVLLVFLAVWILRCFNVSFETELVEKTHLLKFFATRSPLDLISY